jgi:hypothetical protein
MPNTSQGRPAGFDIRGLVRLPCLVVRATRVRDLTLCSWTRWIEPRAWSRRDAQTDARNTYSEESRRDAAALYRSGRGRRKTKKPTAMRSGSGHKLTSSRAFIADATDRSPGDVRLIGPAWLTDRERGEDGEPPQSNEPTRRPGRPEPDLLSRPSVRHP